MLVLMIFGHGPAAGRSRDLRRDFLCGDPPHPRTRSSRGFGSAARGDGGISFAARYAAAAMGMAEGVIAAQARTRLMAGHAIRVRPQIR